MILYLSGWYRKALYFGLLCSIAAASFTSCSGGPHNGAPSGSDDDSLGAAHPVLVRRVGKKIEKDNALTMPHTLAESGIHGRVHFISYWRYSMNRWGHKTPLAKGYYSFDSAGNLLCHNEFTTDSTQVVSCMYEYDEHGRPVEWDIMDVSIGRDSKILFQYGKNGLCTSQITEDKDPKFSKKSVYRYDRYGNEVQQRDYAPGGRITDLITTAYDSMGNQVEIAYRTPDFVVRGRTTCTYDAGGSELAGRKYGPDSAMLMQWRCRNDSQGRCAERTYLSPDGTKTMSIVYSYNTHGNLVSNTISRADGSLDEDGSYSYDYVYDKAGNILKRTKYVTRFGNRRPSECIEYDISYIDY